MNTALEVFLERVGIHEVGEAGSELRVLYSSGLQFEPEVRVDRQKQAIKPPNRAFSQGRRYAAVVTTYARGPSVSHPSGRFRPG